MNEIMQSVLKIVSARGVSFMSDVVCEVIDSKPTGEYLQHAEIGVIIDSMIREGAFSCIRYQMPNHPKQIQTLLVSIETVFVGNDSFTGKE